MLISLLRESAQYTVYLHIHPNATQVRSDAFALKALCVSSSLELHAGVLNYSLALQRYCSIAVLHIRSYEIKRLLDNKNICRQFFIVDVVDNVD